MYVRGYNSLYIHAIPVVDNTPFAACDAILVITGGTTEVLTFKSGATVTVDLSSTPKGTILPFALTNIDTTAGVYIALYA